MKNTLKRLGVAAIIAAITLFSLATCGDPAQKVIIYTVTFDANGATGGAAPRAQKVNAGSSITLPDEDDLARAGYTFGGWNTDGDGAGANYQSGDFYTPVRTITLYARWIAYPRAADFAVTGTGTFAYDGTAKTVHITAQAGKSPGTITVLYNGSTTAPVNAGTYTVTFNVAATEGFNAMAGLVAGTVTITKAAGATAAAPTAAAIGANTVTLNAVTVVAGQTVEYAHNGGNTAPASGWQTGITFNGLAAGTAYYFFARSAGNDNYETGAASGGLPVTTLQTVSPNRIAYYWVDEHGSLVTTGGGAVTVLQNGPLAITAQDAGYTVRQWHLNGIDTGQSGNTYNFSSPTVGKHIVGLFVEKDGRFYNTNITITVALAYTVTFLANNATSGAAPADQAVIPGSSITLPGQGNLARTGYDFGGWNTNNGGTGTNYNAGASYTPTGNVTLYAKWNAIYTVTFNINSGTGTTPPAQTGSVITLPSGSGFSRNNYAFGGWNTNTNGTGTNYAAGASYTPTGNITLYARWGTPNTVTFNANGGSGTAPSSITTANGSSIILPDQGSLTRIDFTFGGWNTSANGTGANYNAGALYPVTATITLYARWNSTKPQIYGFEWIPSGTFIMGNGDTDAPQHQVTLTRGFYMKKTEITQAEYQAVMGTNPSSNKGDNLPVENVSWIQAVNYCNTRSQQEGLTPVYTITLGTTVTADWTKNGYRLPTEAEWEYAARGGDGSPGNYTYAGSNDPDEVAWYSVNNSPYGSKPVGTKAANGLGLYDMSGNVAEWCWDWYDNYPSGAQTDPRGPSSTQGVGNGRVYRGGAWDLANIYAFSATRRERGPNIAGINNIGFRVVRW